MRMRCASCESTDLESWMRRYPAEARKCVRCLDAMWAAIQRRYVGQAMALIAVLGLGLAIFATAVWVAR